MTNQTSTTAAAKTADTEAVKLAAVREMVAALPVAILRQTLKAAGHAVWMFDDGDLKTYAVVVFSQAL